jgi:hypothetical protein
MSLTKRLLVATLMLLSAATALADKYSDTVDLFRNAGASSAFFDHCYGYAIFPTIGKAGFIIGAARGSGQVIVGSQHVGNTTMTQITAGLLAGGQGFSQVIFFQDERSFGEFSGGNFEFGANASAVAITAGASATAATSGASAGASGGKKDATTVGSGYHKGVKIFTIAKGGLMLEASVGGQKFSYTAVDPVAVLQADEGLDPATELAPVEESVDLAPIALETQASDEPVATLESIEPGEPVATVE